MVFCRGNTEHPQTTRKRNPTLRTREHGATPRLGAAPAACCRRRTLSLHWPSSLRDVPRMRPSPRRMLHLQPRDSAGWKYLAQVFLATAGGTALSLSDGTVV